MRQQTPYYQSGISATSAILLLLLLGFVSIFLIKLTPIYVENYSVKQSVRSLSTETGLDEAKLRERLMKRLQINSVSNVTAKDIKIINRGLTTRIEVKYEVRIPLFFNIDAVVSFRDEAEVKNR